MTLIVTLIMTLSVTMIVTLITPVGHKEAVPGHSHPGVEWDVSDRGGRDPTVPRGSPQQCAHRRVSRLPAHPE